MKNRKRFIKVYSKHKRISKADVDIGDNEKKINKRILKKREEARRFRITAIVLLLLISSPFWFYRGIMHGMILQIWGVQTKAVLAGTMAPPKWSNYRYRTPCYYYAFYKDGKLYEKNSAISIKDSLYHIGDTVNVLYLKSLPFISSCVKNDVK